MEYEPIYLSNSSYFIIEFSYCFNIRKENKNPFIYLILFIF